MNQANEIITINGKEYELVDTKDATGLVSNGKFIEGAFKDGHFYPTSVRVLAGYLCSDEWRPLNLLPARPKPVEPMIWEGEASEYAHAIMPIQFAGKRVRVVAICESE